ncbi:MAG: oligosaccharide flippase family protein [Caldilineaceae bacterium]|nr:oligosaccharide flippase family protein [Caldilineaceae bacterium]
MVNAEQSQSFATATTSATAASHAATGTAHPAPQRPALVNLSRLPKHGMLTGSALFFISTTVVNGGNYLFNLLLGRWLGPTLFADVSIIITLFLLFTFVTAGFQQTAAKFAAVYSANGDEDKLYALRRWLNRRSWIIGLIGCAILGGGATFWQRFFHTTSPWIFVIFAIGLPFYFVQGIDRGLLQGQMRFGRLAASYQAEMWVRLFLGLLLVAIGWAAEGAIWGLTISILATWLVADYALRTGRHSSKPGEETSVRHTSSRSNHATATLRPQETRAILHFAVPVLLAEISLILINNSDVLIVKRFFDGVTAGHYAALALIGRIVFFGTWSVVITMFPLVAQKAQRRESHRHLLWIGLGMVSAVSLAIVGTTAVVPELIVNVLFGSEYLRIAPLLWLYATATALFALANVLINYHLALGNRTGTVIALIAGLSQVLTLIFFHATLYQVVTLQIGLMSGLLLLLLLWDQFFAPRGEQ